MPYIAWSFLSPVARQVLKKNLFSVFLAQNDEEESEISFGECPKSLGPWWCGENHEAIWWRVVGIMLFYIDLSIFQDVSLNTVELTEVVASQKVASNMK